MSRLPLSGTATVLLSIATALIALLSILDHAGLSTLPPTDAVFVAAMLSLAAAYRPGWVFLLLVAMLPLETVNVAPGGFPMALRPYQILTVAVYAGLAIRLLARRPLPDLPRPGIHDLMLLLLPVGALIATQNATSPVASIRFAVILTSFFALYWLFRVYVRSSGDIRRILPFVVMSMVATSVTAVAQNLAFLRGNGSFEVMPGRPNAMFAEPDWLGMFLVLFLAFCVSSYYFLATRGDSLGTVVRTRRFRLVAVMQAICTTALIITVSRSAWLGAIASVMTALILPMVIRHARISGFLLAATGTVTVIALAFVLYFPLTDFDLTGRAASVGSGNQRITVSCDREAPLPGHITSIGQLTDYGCRHIDLQETDTERSLGKFVTTLERDDPNVSIRREIYERSFQLGRTHPILGVGWGTVTTMLGADERGAGLNSSNLLLEIWLGSGVVGLLGLLGFLFIAGIRSFSSFLRNGGTFPYFLVVAFSGLFVFDLFNAGILLGFLWALFGIAGSFASSPQSFTETV